MSKKIEYAVFHIPSLAFVHNAQREVLSYTTPHAAQAAIGLFASKTKAGDYGVVQLPTKTRPQI